MTTETKMRRMRNLLFMFVFFCGLLSLSAFGGKAIETIKKEKAAPVESSTYIEVEEPEYKPIINYEVKPVKMEMKILSY